MLYIPLLNVLKTEPVYIQYRSSKTFKICLVMYALISKDLPKPAT